MSRVHRALISVHDKTGVVDFAKGLAALGVEILSTGGTAKLLRQAGLGVVDVAEVTGFPEMLDGRVKTLHPKVHGGILARRDRPEHMAALEAHGIAPIDLVAVTLYPFEATVGKSGVTIEEAIENIDIGGPSMIRGAAKNHSSVAVITDADQYAAVLAELSPHQSAAFYRLGGQGFGLSAVAQLHGPELGYNNLLDWSAALGLLLEFGEPAAVVIKHTNPCGVALGRTVGEAMRKAKACDPVSMYGGIVGVNRRLDMETVKELSGILLEILFAPGYEPDALEELKRTKKKCRVFQLPCARAEYPARLDEARSVMGGLLLQDADLTDLDPAALRVVSKRAPTEAEMTALRFAWRVAKHAKSNAIVLATADQVVGVGAGQMNRVDAARIAVMRARELGLETRGTVCASDAFFPFRDGLDVVAKAGATAVLHPGGSLRDEEVIAAADEQAVAMVVCGIRHFKH